MRELACTFQHRDAVHSGLDLPLDDRLVGLEGRHSEYWMTLATMAEVAERVDWDARHVQLVPQPEPPGGCSLIVGSRLEQQAHPRRRERQIPEGLRRVRLRV